VEFSGVYEYKRSTAQWQNEGEGSGIATIEGELPSSNPDGAERGMQDHVKHRRQTGVTPTGIAASVTM